jgi:hypothetical protein
MYLQYNYVPNLLNIPTNGATVSVRKSASENELFFVRLCVRKIMNHVGNLLARKYGTFFINTYFYFK